MEQSAFSGELDELYATLVTIEAGDEVGTAASNVHCRERLGGLLHYYYRDAA